MHLRKEPQSLPRTKNWDFTIHVPNYETFILFILTSHFFGKALYSTEYDWSLKISIGVTSTSEANFRWQFPLIFTAKKKTRSYCYFQRWHKPTIPCCPWHKVINSDIKQIISMQLMQSQVFDPHVTTESGRTRYNLVQLLGKLPCLDTHH